MNVCIISGSSRKNSSSIRVAKFLKHSLKGLQRFQNIFLIDLVDNDFPLISREDLNKNHLSTFQKNITEAMTSSHLIFFVYRNIIGILIQN